MARRSDSKNLKKIFKTCLASRGESQQQQTPHRRTRCYTSNFQRCFLGWTQAYTCITEEQRTCSKAGSRREQRRAFWEKCSSCLQNSLSSEPQGRQEWKFSSFAPLLGALLASRVSTVLGTNSGLQRRPVKWEMEKTPRYPATNPFTSQSF